MGGNGEPRVGLALSGGGAKGAFEAGVIQALDDEGIRPTVLAGTSAGALNAAALAVGLDAETIVDMWTSMESRDVYRPRRDLQRLLDLSRTLDPRRWAETIGSGRNLTDQLLDTIGWSWLLDTWPLRERLVDLLGGEELPLAEGRVLTVPAVDLTSGRLVRFTNQAPIPARDNEDTIVGPMHVDHLVASSAIPLLFRPPRIGGQLYWDGGLVANTPLRAALQHEPDLCFVVATGAVSSDAGEPSGFGDALALVLDHVLRFALLEDLDHARTVNQLVAAAPGATKHKRVEFVLIAPEERTDGGLGDLLDFEPGRAGEQVEAGRRRAHEVIERWRSDNDDG